ncbi:7579_t:CDS:2 [Ambispora gerdemannii]|uniref:DnaJ homolog 1, mitochondrial n=1 Tax=Ambispora gerdemannii TaxID=144530 RepID=A0A9N8ZUE2_9GLOM|nr:7579_t:CDS:2 [Ambispora gerdemannii]
MAKKNYYNTLGVAKNASETEIKSAYPDERMKEINEAYGVLSNPKKRHTYDQYGSEEAFRQGPNATEGFGPDSSFFKDIFDTFFGGETDYARQRTRSADRTSPQPGSDILINLVLTFKESVLGTKKKITLELEKACSACRQTGAYSPSDTGECPTCQGRGVVNTIQKTVLGAIRTQITCSRCQGKGKIIKKRCGYCLGKKFLALKEIIELSIPRGVQPEQKLRYQGIGNDGLHGGSRGDIYVEIKVKENSYFQRKDNDIHVNLPISFLDAILGNQVEVITLEGIEKVFVPPGTQNGDYLSLRGRGCYLGINKTTRGDFYAWLQVKIPKKITGTTETILQNLRKESS